MDQPKLTPQKIIDNPKGDLYHAMTKGDPGFVDFGTAYFSTVNQGTVKGWKLHTEMTCNLLVPKGKVRFVVLDHDWNPLLDETLGRDNYQRLTIPPNHWFAFQGVEGENLILNIADIPHRPDEGRNAALETFPFDWNTPA